MGAYSPGGGGMDSSGSGNRGQMTWLGCVKKQFPRGTEASVTESQPCLANCVREPPRSQSSSLSSFRVTLAPATILL